MQFTEPSSKAALSEAIALMQQSMDVVWDYLQEKHHELTDKEWAELIYFREALWENYTASAHLMYRGQSSGPSSDALAPPN